MITHLRIRGWRSFAEQALNLGPGVTFVLAENGVGKTSLIEAAAWGVYGPLSGVDVAAARRVGADDAYVEVDIELPDGTVLQVKRHFAGRTESVEATVDGMPIVGDKVPDVLSDSLGASAEFLARTTIVPSSAASYDASGAFQLHAHLCWALGVDQLQGAAAAFEELHELAEGEAKSFRATTRRASAGVVALRVELAALDAQIASQEAARSEARAAWDAAEAELRRAGEHQELNQRAELARAALAEALDAAERVLGERPSASSPADLEEVLGRAEENAAQHTDELRQHAAVASGRLAAVTASAGELDDVSNQCPVCLRPMSADDVEHALRAHTDERARLSAQHEELSGQADAAARRLDAVRRVLRRALHVPTVTATDTTSALDAESAARRAADARARYEELAGRSAQLRSTRTTLENRIADEEQAAQVSAAARTAHQRAAAARLAALTARATADRVLTERIDPLVNEVQHRWKRVFGDRDWLQLRPDGRLVLVRGVDEIAFEHFSSGEKVIALLAVRLLVLGASTQASFMWLDEPLEHLDPRNRRLIASLMTAAGAQVRQILVTTYEESVARRLAARGDAAIVRVRSDR